MNKKIYQPELTDFLNAQLLLWQEANQRYANLGKAERRLIQAGDMTIAIQHNPARITSTGAKTDADSIKKRKCFLCRINRPEVQAAWEIEPGWDFLVNPFPIFPFHFTIASQQHEMQNHIPAEMAIFAERLPGMVVFYNGARAGASAPDHLHCQAVPAEELPLIAFTEKNHISAVTDLRWSNDFQKKAPFCYLSAIISNDSGGMSALRQMLRICGAPSENAEADPNLVNAYFWIDKTGRLRVIVIPRRAHRPAAYFKEGEDKITVSPGAVDMAGVIITPVEKDFRRLSEEDVYRIYQETAYVDLPPVNFIA